MKKCLMLLILVGLVSMPAFAIQQLTRDDNGLLTENDFDLLPIIGDAANPVAGLEGLDGTDVGLQSANVVVNVEVMSNLAMNDPFLASQLDTQNITDQQTRMLVLALSIPNIDVEQLKTDAGVGDSEITAAKKKVRDLKVKFKKMKSSLMTQQSLSDEQRQVLEGLFPGKTTYRDLITAFSNITLEDYIQ